MVHEGTGECGADSAHAEGVRVNGLSGCLECGWDWSEGYFHVLCVWVAGLL